MSTNSNNTTTSTSNKGGKKPTKSEDFTDIAKNSFAMGEPMPVTERTFKNESGDTWNTKIFRWEGHNYLGEKAVMLAYSTYAPLAVKFQE